MEIANLWPILFLPVSFLCDLGPPSLKSVSLSLYICKLGARVVPTAYKTAVRVKK